MIGNSWKYRFQGWIFSLAATFGFLLLSVAGMARSSDYRVAQILSIRDGSVTKSRFTGESFGGVHFVTSRPYKSRAYEMTIAAGEDRYDLILEVRSKDDDLSFLRSGNLLEVRVQEAKGRAFIKGAEGKEWKVSIKRKWSPGTPSSWEKHLKVHPRYLARKLCECS